MKDCKKKCAKAEVQDKSQTRLEFSKKLMVFATAVYAATWVVAVVSWLLGGEVPEELMLYTTGLYGSAFAVYGGKSAYENKPKIERGGGDGI